MPHSVTSYKKRGENVTFTENLEKAKAGDKRAYGMLCNLSADTLYGIALKYRTSADTLARLNRLRSPYTIRVGQVLRIK